MFNIINRISPKKLILILLLIVLFLITVVLLVTRAFINPVVSDEALSNINVSSCGYYTLSENSSSVDLTNSFPMSDNQGMLTDPYVFNLENSCDINKGFNLYLVVTTESVINDDSIKLKLSSKDEVTKVSSLPEATLTDDIINQYQTTIGKEIKKVYLLESATLAPDLPVTFSLNMWIDKDAINVPQNANFNATIMVADGNTSSDDILYPNIYDVCQGENMADCYFDYYYYDDNLLKHDETLANSAGDNNLRYSGSTYEVDNYVCFGSEVSPCPADNFYRIIGVYNQDGSNKIKLIKNDSIGSVQWDSNTNNTYEISSIRTYLNNDFYNNFSTNYKNMISESTWNVGGYVTYGATAKTWYVGEVSNPEVPDVVSDKISLMYGHDFGYAANQSAWNTSLKNYNTNNIPDDNWITTGIKEWLVAPETGATSVASRILIDNYMYSENVSNFNEARPTFYLNSDVMLASGTGDLYDPIRVTTNNFSNMILNNNGGKDAIEAKPTPNLKLASTTNEGMFMTEDDYGSSYYFRGTVDNNWVYFGGFYWRIMRINGDGSVRMIYTGTTAPTESQKVIMTGSGTSIGTTAFNSTKNNIESAGYMYELGNQHGFTESSVIKTYIDQWYENNILNTGNHLLISDAIYCNDRDEYTASNGNAYFGSYYRTSHGLNEGFTPSLKCNKADSFTVDDEINGNGALLYPVATVTADDLNFSGFKSWVNITTNYLYTNYGFWTMSPVRFFSNESSFVILNSSGHLGSGGTATFHSSVRPVISVSSNVNVTGSGLWNDPYTIN